MEHIDFSVLSTGQLIDKLDGILIQLKKYSPSAAYSDSNTNILRWVEDTYLLLTAQRLAVEIINGLQSDDTTHEYTFSYSSAAKMFHAVNLGLKLFKTPYFSTSYNERKPFLPWLEQEDYSVDSFLSADNKLNRYTLIHELNDKLSTCREISLQIIEEYHMYSRTTCLLQVQKAKREYNEAKDRCRSSEWEDKKLMMKNDNIDKLKANHFGKYFYDKVDDTDRRFHYALVDCFPSATLKIDYDKETNLYEIITEFYYLQALYCLLHDEDPTPPEFREKTSQQEKETQLTDTTDTQKEPNNYTPEERQKIIGCYTGFAKIMELDTHWITDIFKPDDDRLWAAIKADKQTPLMHPNRTDGTNISPLLNLLGVLCRTGKLEKGSAEYYNKLLTNFPYLTKGKINPLVKNGSRDNPRKLASIIEKRLGNLPI